MSFFRHAAAVMVVGISLPAYAAGTHDAGHGARIGYEGVREDASTTVEVIMTDNHFHPPSMRFKEGETVRFIIVNDGELVHEFAIATPEMHAEHRQEMIQMMHAGVLEPDRINYELLGYGASGLRHDHANGALLEPGDAAEVIWTFDTHASVEIACNVPGHYESGMVASIALSH
jgi:uncharacterized cupredoxin-like copper-binding protein